MAETAARQDVSLPFHFDVLVEPQDGEYVAHCLQLDIVAAGQTREAAVSDVIDLIQAQIEFAVEHDNVENVLKPAPPEVWQRFTMLDADRVRIALEEGV